WHNIAQFTGAINDNIFKFTAIYAILAVRPQANPEEITGIVGVAFALPFLIFLIPAGILGDIFSKKLLLRLTKTVELLALVFAFVSVEMASPILLYGAVFLLSTQSAFFAPIKYGILPEIVQTEALARANGAIQATTYLAIIAGTILAPSLSFLFANDYSRSVLVCLLLSLVGTLSAWKVEPLTETVKRETSLEIRKTPTLRAALDCIIQNKLLGFSILALAVFSLFGSYLQLNLIPFGLDQLKFPSAEAATLLFLVVALGLGIGALLAGQLCRQKIDIGLPLPAAAGMSLFGILLPLLPATPVGISQAIGFCFFMGIAGGVFLVPLETLLQVLPPPHLRASVIACSNFLSWIAILLGATLTMFFASLLDWKAHQGILAISSFCFLLVAACLSSPF
ncbi:MAG: MFS transporter, partial [Chthoniobacterales bacterium]|nr:MFS transporter [Chthoniobacterales bacterium]